MLVTCSPCGCSVTPRRLGGQFGDSIGAMRYRRLLSLVVVHTLCIGAASAGVDHYDVGNGLSQNSVVAIETDARGFVWLGTEDGLNRFDGHSFKVFRGEPGEPGLPDNFIQRLARVDETLWIGTIGGGLARMNLLDERIAALAQLLPHAVPARNTIYALLPLGGERVLIGAADGIHQVHWPLDGSAARSRALGPTAGLSGQLVRALAAMPDGRIVAGGESDLCVFDATLSQCTALSLDPPEGRSRSAVMALGIGTGSQVWISIDAAGLLRVDLDSGDRRWLRFGGPELPSSMARVLSLEGVGQGDVWIGSDIGTFRYRADCDCVGPRVDAERDDAQAARKLVYAVKADGDRRIWSGAWNHGLDRYDPDRQAIERWRPQLGPDGGSGSSSVRALVADGERLWLGVYGLGVIQSRLDADTGAAFTQPDALRPATVAQSLVWAIARDRRGRLWIGSDAGLARWDPVGGRQDIAAEIPAQRPNSIRALLIDRGGTLWVGGEDGLHSVEVEAGEPRLRRMAAAPPELPDRRVFALHEDPHGQLWVGTWQGVYPFDRAARRAGPALAPDAHLRLTWDIADGDAGGLWIGTSDGLVQVGADGRWRRYTERDGLANRVVYGIERDRAGMLWLSTNRGIVRFDPGTGQAVNFDLQDQLQHAEFLFGAHGQDASGRLLFGGPGGFNRVDPTRIVKAEAAPVPVLTGVRIDQIELDVASGRIAAAAPMLTEVSILPTESVLELHYGAIAHDQPRGVRFRYRLKGFDRDWQSPGERRFASYTNLPSGTYQFEIEAIGRFGQASTSPRVLIVHAIPWWWETPTFRALVALSVILIAFAAVRWRLADLRGQREALRQQVRQRTAEIEQQRDQLARVNAELAALSTRDPLTGLANRRALLDTLAGAIATAREIARPISVALIDLDHFKRINDGRGHAVGDLALVHLAQLWPARLPSSALLGRYGGEEFLLLLPGTGAAQAQAELERLLTLLRQSPVAGVTPDLQVTASVGVAELHPGESLEGLINRADEALYRAKRAGRDRCELA